MPYTRLEAGGPGALVFNLVFNAGKRKSVLKCNVLHCALRAHL